MKVDKSVADTDLARLKALATEFLATETPEPAVFDQLASLAAGVAAGYREKARLELMQRIADMAPTIFPTLAEDFRAGLEHTPHDELTSLVTLLDEATTARTAFGDADSALMAARERGDYGAMAPLALEADAKKNVFAVASAQFANRVGLGDVLMPDLMPADVPPPQPRPAAPEMTPAAATPVTTEATEEACAGVAEDAAPQTSAPETTAPENASEQEPLELNSPVTSPAERRRVRDLIRHIRPATEQPSAAP